ncbi:CCA tRNA nucleotidyltransferase [Sinanaerobacter chloroacetimidivorans]|uniref:CCA tRNA nucleotidyltransferase n=1 Tax=Sinanaerobacter chloroacetimidivorans TaxID=2818044 RepID=A0A8J7W2G8_9FIRM|nr:CCA tRNA nucleotidyltransferase [Sinanaerobacter chloroacetimidivorans]MBR0598183.1 CCA tRNA nucleotidyltransferase [Sinanaerobacter chloroacetimidivorans]
MIKLPKEVNKILRTIESAGFEAYVVGGSLRDTLLAKEPEDWDIATSAPMDKILELFPDAHVIGEKFGVVRIREGNITADTAAFRIDGQYSDFRRPDGVIFTANIEEDLSRRDFTINAMAGHPEGGILDLFQGREDLKLRLVRAVGDPAVRFEEDPLRMLRGIRFAAQLDFDLDRNTFEAMKGKASLLSKVSTERIREEFLKIITAKNSSKGLKMCMASGLLPEILGEECFRNAGKSELRALTELAENIDRAKIDTEYRIGLVYLCFEKDRALKAIEKMKFDKETEKMLRNALCHLEDLSFINNRIELKQFICKMGLEQYEYLENLSKQQRKVYDFNEYKIRNRMIIFEDIMKFKEPIFIEDLAVTGRDLIEMGMKEGEEIGKMLRMLLDVVHKNPSVNNQKDLLRKAKEFNRNPISAWLRGVRWYK